VHISERDVLSMVQILLLWPVVGLSAVFTVVCKSLFVQLADNTHCREHRGCLRPCSHIATYSHIDRCTLCTTHPLLPQTAMHHPVEHVGHHAWQPPVRGPLRGGTNSPRGGDEDHGPWTRPSSNCGTWMMLPWRGKIARTPNS